MLESLRTQVITDRDGNVIRRGMSVVSGGDSWIVGSVSPHLIRLDRRVDSEMPYKVRESRFVGRS